MNTKHTPGPWFVGTVSGGNVNVSAGNPGSRSGLVASCDAGDYARSKEEGMANARLIAAAPELLEALQLVEFIYGEQLDEKMLTCNAKFPTAGMYVRAAIAKARGGA